MLPIWGLSQKLSRLIGVSRAKELSLTGNFLGAQRAEAWGLVNRVVPADELLPQARALALDMLSLAPGLPVSAFVTAISFLIYVICRVIAWQRDRRTRVSAVEPALVAAA